MIISKLIWDSWNIAHIAKHKVEPEEVEEVCGNKNLFEKGRDGTYKIIGQTLDGRYLTIILASRGASFFYPVTVRDADNKERRRFSKRL